MSHTALVDDFRAKLVGSQREGLGAVEAMLAENAETAARYLATDHVELARVLNVAAARVLAGELEKDEVASLASVMSGNPAYLARLLTGLGA
jgi:hypothetical protein